MEIDEAIQTFIQKAFTTGEPPFPPAVKELKSHLTRIIAAERLDELEQVRALPILHTDEKMNILTIIGSHTATRIAKLTHQANGESA